MSRQYATIEGLAGCGPASVAPSKISIPDAAESDSQTLHHSCCDTALNRALIYSQLQPEGSCLKTHAAFVGLSPKTADDGSRKGESSQRQAVKLDDSRPSTRLGTHSI
jgi:hypothetical protein